MEQKPLCLLSTRPEPQELTQPNSANSSESPSSNDHRTASVDSQIEIQQPNDQTLAHETPKQDEVKAEIVKIESKTTTLTSLKESGLATTENVKHFKEARDQLKEKKQKLKALISDTQRQRKRRAEKKKVISEMSNQSNSNASKLRKFTHALSGRLPLEDAYPQLHQAIVELATAGAGADFRRRTDVLNVCKTLDDLHTGLLKEGYVLSCQALYLRLIPRRSDTIERKSHVRKVPVKIRKAQNTLRNKHEDANFCFATKKYMKDIASLFGAENDSVLSADDKAKVQIGVTAANKQSPLIMAS